MSGATKECVWNGRRASREQPNGVLGTGQVRVEHVEGVRGGESGTAGLCRTLRAREAQV